MSGHQPPTPTSSSPAPASRRRAWSGPAVFAAVLAITAAVGPTVVDGARDRLEHESVPLLAEAAPTTSVDAGPVLTPATAAPVSTLPQLPASPTTDVASTVTSIQTVPAVRDVVIAIGDEELLTDADGVIVVPDGLDGPVEVRGVRANPPLETVDFATWADGSVAATRPLGELVGPVAAVGVTVSSRVVAAASGPSPPSARLVLDSDTGPLELPLGQAQWVASVTAIAADGSVTAQPLTYRASALVIDDERRPLDEQTFRATPEALWMVAV